MASNICIVHKTLYLKLYFTGKRRWSDEENRLFMEAMGRFIAEKIMPPAEVYEDLTKTLKTRTTPQIRVKVHNIIHGKQKQM